MREYQDMMAQVRRPTELDERVLTAAGKKRRGQFGVWAAACAACLVMLAAGGIGLQSGRDVPAIEEKPIPVLDLSAAEAGANGGLAFLEAEKHLADRTVKVETKTYYLTEENLRSFINEDGSEVLVPALTGDTETVSGLYAVPEDSVWLRWPVEGSNTVSMSAPYGLRRETAFFHSGIDIPGEQGLPVLAAEAGTVTETGFDPARGNYLILDHGGGLTTLYGQCQEVLVQAGDAVEAGETVALVGATGMATGPHLHFEVRQDGVARNPVAYFEASLRETLKMG